MKNILIAVSDVQTYVVPNDYFYTTFDMCYLDAWQNQRNKVVQTIAVCYAVIGWN